ncbi:uncharacterized protein LOC127832185 isoform X1 [Dreissena polymorpha]|uniref:B box-type domain-containing protein n=1 Tax=Dreissena polymorpha TaxID=45954 RepID=A0A9D4GN08_DREPO|nr:uncharacterized protein LOC127832185 isoform X1 [Dreissena polymorpha]KAH3820396.1 hypothetical protein DPMN_122142 [Dreissena polymorpha]
MDDYACDICEENEICEEAKFYCEKCSKCYCTSCVEHHYQMHKAHKTLRIERLRNWPFGKGIENESEQSQEHKDQKLTQLCEEHDQLLPTACNVFSHQECSKVKLMADNVTDLQPSPDVDTLHEQLIQKETELENNLPSQDKSYKVTGELFNPINVAKKKTRVRHDTEYSVKIDTDSDTCWISGICATTTGELLITDMWNNKLKLLDDNYKVVTHLDFSDKPWSICRVDSSQVAVTVYDNQIHFISVTNGELVEDITFQLEHSCRGIAHHQGNLYITSGTTLYQYTVNGSLVNKLYHNNVTSCGVSPDGERIYVTSGARDQLITLSRDGAVISKMTDPVLQWNDILPGMHVTNLGQVLVCGGDSNTILQVNRDGTKRRAILATEKSGVVRPTCVYYSKHTNSIIIGMFDNENILVIVLE